MPVQLQILSLLFADYVVLVAPSGDGLLLALEWLPAECEVTGMKNSFSDRKRLCGHSGSRMSCCPRWRKVTDRGASSVIIWMLYWSVVLKRFPQHHSNIVAVVFLAHNFTFSVHFADISWQQQADEYNRVFMSYRD